MIFDCPECGARVRGPKPGAVVACHACQSPVVVPEPPPEPKPEPVEAPEPTAPEPWTTQKLWSTAALVVIILAVAHVGLFLLLTMDARAAVRDVESRHTQRELETAKRPDSAPEPGTPAYGEWSRAVERWEDAEAWRVHGRQVMLLRTGLLLSFLILVGITAWGVFGLLKRRPAPR